MKTLVLTTALVVLTTLTFAQSETTKMENPQVLNTEDVQASIFPTSNDMVTMLVDKKPGTTVVLKVKEENGKLLYQKRIKKHNSSKIKFDINEFPSGVYTFELVKNKEVLYTKKIDKSENTLAVVQ